MKTRLGFGWAVLAISTLGLLCGCGSDGTIYRAPSSEYLMEIDAENNFAFSRASAPGGTDSPVSEGVYETIRSGFFSLTTGGDAGVAEVVTYGLLIPGYGMFMRPDQASSVMLPFLLKSESCPGNARWNWVSWRSSTASDSATSAFVGVFSFLDGALSHLKRFDLTTQTDLGTGDIAFAQACEENEAGYAVGDGSSGGAAWYFQGSTGILGKVTSTEMKDLVLGFNQQQFTASDITGTYSGLAIRRVGTTETVHFPRFVASQNGSNLALVGNPVQLPEDSVDTSRAFNISLTSFNTLADGIATGTATVTDAALLGGTSASMNISCIGKKTLADLARPVLFCVSEGYVGTGASKASAQTFNFILRGE